MKKCKFCAETDLQDDAIKCKHCHQDLKEAVEQVKETPKKKRRLWGNCLILAIFGIIVWGLFSSYMVHYLGNMHGDVATMDSACAVAHEFVESKLKYPASSEFPPDCNVAIQDETTSTIFTVNHFVNAANGFGAKERKSYSIKLQYLGGATGPYDKNNWEELDFYFNN